MLNKYSVFLSKSLVNLLFFIFVKSNELLDPLIIHLDDMKNANNCLYTRQKSI